MQSPTSKNSVDEKRSDKRVKSSQYEPTTEDIDQLEISYPVTPADPKTHDPLPQSPLSPTSPRWGTLEPMLFPVGKPSPTLELASPTLVPAPEVAPTTSDSKRPRSDKEEKRSRTRSRSRSRHRRRSPSSSRSPSPPTTRRRKRDATPPPKRSHHVDSDSEPPFKWTCLQDDEGTLSRNSNKNSDRGNNNSNKYGRLPSEEEPIQFTLRSLGPALPRKGKVESKHRAIGNTSNNPSSSSSSTGTIPSTEPLSSSSHHKEAASLL